MKSIASRVLPRTAPRIRLFAEARQSAVSSDSRKAAAPGWVGTARPARRSRSGPARRSRSGLPGNSRRRCSSASRIAYSVAMVVRSDAARIICEGCSNRSGTARFGDPLARVCCHGLRHVAPSSMIASVFVVVALWSGSATAALSHGAFLIPPASPASLSSMVSAANPVGSTHNIRSPQGDGGFNLTLPVADRTILPTPSSHHPTPRHYKPVRHSNRPAQQYYQPARQYYQWQVH